MQAAPLSNFANSHPGQNNLRGRVQFLLMSTIMVRKQFLCPQLMNQNSRLIFVEKLPWQLWLETEGGGAGYEMWRRTDGELPEAERLYNHALLRRVSASISTSKAFEEM